MSCVVVKSTAGKTASPETRHSRQPRQLPLGKRVLWYPSSWRITLQSKVDTASSILLLTKESPYANNYQMSVIND